MDTGRGRCDGYSFELIFNDDVCHGVPWFAVEPGKQATRLSHVSPKQAYYTLEDLMDLIARRMLVVHVWNSELYCKSPTLPYVPFYYNVTLRGRHSNPVRLGMCIDQNKNENGCTNPDCKKAHFCSYYWCRKGVTCLSATAHKEQGQLMESH